MAIQQINIINNSGDDRLHIAIYQKPTDGGIPQTTAWHVAALSKGATAYVPIPDCYAVQLRYARGGINYRSRCAPVIDFRGAYQAAAEEGCMLLSELDQPPRDNVVTVVGDASIGQPVGACIVLGGDPVYGPLYINPTTMIHFGIRPYVFYLAQVGPEVSDGSILDTGALTATEVAIRPHQTATITGDKETGYSIAIKEGLDSAECGC